MENHAVLNITNVSKKIGNKKIVTDISLKLYEGDILGFIGANGAGKTTTMKLILGLQTITKGSIKIMGKDINKDFSNAIKNVGAIIESPDLYMYLTGYQNLLLVSIIYHIPKKRIKEVVELVGLTSAIHMKVKKYSLGMRQRLGIAQAILHKPKLLILDEPMNGLDPEGINDLKKLLKDLATHEKMTIMLSSHILSELENICNRICILSKGKIIKDDDYQKIKQEADEIDYTLELSNTSLENILSQYKKIDKTHIEINTTKKGLNTIIKTLLLNEISIYEIKKKSTTLEQLFLNISESQKR